jgi:tetratricopeptide (TPR) repeat protein
VERREAPPGYPPQFIIEQRNPVAAKQCEKQALDLYRDRALQGKEANLFGAVRLFQQALAHYGTRGYFADPAVDKTYREALKELEDEVYRRYSEGIVRKKADSYKKAYEAFNGILAIMPDNKSPIFENVARHRADLKRRHPDLK